MFIVLRPGTKTDMKNGQKTKDYNDIRNEQGNIKNR